MPGVSYVPANGRWTPFSGAIWVPSTVTLKLGLGRKYAVISCAFDSSIPICPARNVGLLCSNRCRTCSQVKGVWAGADVWASTQYGNIASTATYFQRSLKYVAVLAMFPYCNVLPEKLVHD